MTEAAPVKFLLITDTHCYADDEQQLEWSTAPVFPNKSLELTLDHLIPYTHDQQALIITGDLAQEEIPKTYQRVKEILTGFPLPIYALSGNHDTPAMMQDNLSSQVQIVSQKKIHDWHFIFINTNKPDRPEGELTIDELEQLEQQLSQIPIEHFVLIFMHHHPIDIQSAWMDRMGLEQREQFWAIISAYPQVRAIFHGHIHQNFEDSYRYVNGREVQVYGTASTCLQLKPKQETIQFDHINPVWRETTLYPSGRIETQTHEIDLGIELSPEQQQLTPPPKL